MSETESVLSPVQGATPEAGAGSGADILPHIVKEFERQLEDTLVHVYSDKSYSSASDETVSVLARFLLTNNIQNIFESITDEEKMGFDNSEIHLTDISVYRDGIYFWFKLPNGKSIRKETRIIQIEDLSKEMYEKYKIIYSKLIKKRDELREKAEAEYEQVRKQKEIKEKLEKLEEMVRKKNELEHENKTLRSLLRKIIEREGINVQEILEEEEEKEKTSLTSEELDILSDFIDDC
jgi:hypothetical protein